MEDNKILRTAEEIVSKKPLEWQIANTIRFLAVDGVQKANSGHPGMPMGCADFATVLWTKIIRCNPKNPKWFNRDRFVLSAGHGSMLLYSVLHLAGYDVSLDDLKNFRQWGSPTPGHPEYNLLRGIETTTGPLGQGFANGVGMAVAAKWFSANFNTQDFPDLINPYIYAIVSDGDLMEGISAESASFAGHNGLDNIIYFYDDNHISIDGPTDLTFSTEDVQKRFDAYGWHTQRIDGMNQEEIFKAIKNAQQTPNKPHLILGRTIIGYGSPNKANKAEVHGSPLGDEEVKLTKQNLGWPIEPLFFIPSSVKKFFEEIRREWEKCEDDWKKKLNYYTQKYPDKSKKLFEFIEKKIPQNLESILPTFPTNSSVETRKASGKCLEKLFPVVENLIGGSADLAPSNNTFVKGYGEFNRSNFKARNFHFGVREHSMGGILNGMSLFGGIIPYGGTFLIFSDYMRPSIRLASFMGIQVIYIFTHDSVFLGEDGPTHQPVEQLPALRVIPNLTVIRPADALETAQAWKITLERENGPTALILTRQGLPVLDWENLFGKPQDLKKGAYILYNAKNGNPDLFIVATGSEVHIALGACEKLEEEGIKARCINVPSWKLFDEQDRNYQESIFPKNFSPVLLIEAANPMGWEKYLGRNFARIAIEGRYGVSAPQKVIAEKFGFTVENAVAVAKRLL